VAARVAAPGADHERGDQDQGQATGDAMREFDQRRQRRIARHDHAVAKRPMTAATGARSAGAHERAPDDHHQDEREYAPGEVRIPPLIVHPWYSSIAMRASRQRTHRNQGAKGPTLNDYAHPNATPGGDGAPPSSGRPNSRCAW
jgi:hypothetical protein